MEPCKRVWARLAFLKYSLLDSFPSYLQVILQTLMQKWSSILKRRFLLYISSNTKKCSKNSLSKWLPSFLICSQSLHSAHKDGCVTITKRSSWSNDQQYRWSTSWAKSLRMITVVRRILCFSVEPEGQKKLTRHGSVEIYDGKFASFYKQVKVKFMKYRLVQPDSSKQAVTKLKQDKARTNKRRSHPDRSRGGGEWNRGGC